MDTDLKIAAADVVFPTVDLIAPTTSGYLVLAAEVDARPPFLGASEVKRRLLARCRQACAEITARDDVVEAVTFRAALIPPGRGAFLDRRPGAVHVARYDVVVLIEAIDVDAAKRLRASPEFTAIEAAVRDAARFTFVVTASNTRRIGPVAHDRNGVFLFNWFFADDTDRNLAVWDYTAGWFQQETRLDNSTVLLPVPGEPRAYNLINHCRWDRLRDIVPSLLFKRSFRSYVLANFDLNDVAAIPVLYRLA